MKAPMTDDDGEILGRIQTNDAEILSGLQSN